jgi:hypothetical protein
MYFDLGPTWLWLAGVFFALVGVVLTFTGFLVGLVWLFNHLTWV